MEKAIERLERKKLLLEIAEVQRAWWKKPTYIAALFPTVLALAALIYGVANGYLQASSERLKAETIKLENQKYNLQTQTEDLQSQIVKISKEEESLQEKRLKIIEQLKETKSLLEKTKLEAAEFEIQIRRLGRTGKQGYYSEFSETKTTIAYTLDEIEKILNE